MFQLLIKLKFILPTMLWVMTFPVYASEYKCDSDTVDFNQGDVLSSEVLSEIIDKINGNIVGISQSELNASWSCKTILERGIDTNNGYSEDTSDFTLASNGDLSFNMSPDYENPADYDGNNIYDLKLTAYDGLETVSQDFSVVVLNVID